MIITTLDIESVSPGYEPPEDRPDKFPPLAYHVPTVIVWLVARHQKELGFNLNVYQYERDLEGPSLKALGDNLQESKRLVTWNGRRFDMPLLNLRAMTCRLDWKWWLKRNGRYGVGKGLYHYDLNDLLTDQTGVGVGLDQVSKTLGLPGKVAMDGKEAAEVWLHDSERVVRYCAEDVVQTYLVYLRYARTFLGADLDSYRNILRAFVDWMENIPLLSELRAQVQPWVLTELDI
jgi:DNA polymerase elongation subunit (family B)